MHPKILLVMPKHREGDRLFPFGVATVYSVLKDHGHDVDFVDCSYGHDDLQDLMDPEELRQYDIVGIGGLVSAYRTVKHDVVPLIRAAASDALVIVGGYLAISTQQLLLTRRLADVVFLGDAEVSILQFLKVHDSRKEWRHIKGITYLNEKGSVVNNGIALLDTVEDAYVPYHKYLDIEKYNAHLPSRERYYPMVVETGCPFSCAFCFNSSGSHVRTRSPEHVIEEIKVALAKYHYPRVFMMAENILMRRRWVAEFCDLIDRNRLRFKWMASGHARVLTEDILKLVAAHGCDRIGIGFENFSQKILDNMNKRTKVEHNSRAIRWMRGNKLFFSGTCIFGYPGEDHETVRENAEFLKEHVLRRSYFYIQPYPLTALWTECVSRGLITDEEGLIERLGDATDFVINLTDLPDDEYFRLRAVLDKASRDAARMRPSVVLRAIKLYGIEWAWFTFKYLLKRWAGRDYSRGAIP